MIRSFDKISKLVHGGADQSLEGVGRSVIFPEMKRKAKTAGQNLSKKTKMALGGLQGMEKGTFDKLIPQSKRSFKTRCGYT